MRIPKICESIFQKILPGIFLQCPVSSYAHSLVIPCTRYREIKTKLESKPPGYKISNTRNNSRSIIEVTWHKSLNPYINEFTYINTHIYHRPSKQSSTIRSLQEPSRLLPTDSTWKQTDQVKWTNNQNHILHHTRTSGTLPLTVRNMSRVKFTISSWVPTRFHVRYCGMENL